MDKGVKAKRFIYLLAQRDYLVHQVGVRYDHAAAAVSLQPQVIEHLLGVLSQLDPLKVRLIDAPYDLAASEAPYRDDHVSSPVGLLPLLPGAAAKRLLRKLPAWVADQERAVIFLEELLQLIVL